MAARHQLISSFPSAYYMATITQVGSNPNSVSGYVNREYARTFASRWERAFPDIKSLIPSKWEKIVKGGLSAAGLSAENKKAQVRIWAGCDPLNFNFTLEFVADLNVSAATIEGQLLALERMVVPGETKGGFLTPPGPNIITSTFAQAGSTGYTTVRIGTKTLNNVVLTSVTVTRKMDFAQGAGVATCYATAQVQGSTQYVLTRNELQ